MAEAEEALTHSTLKESKPLSHRKLTAAVAGSSGITCTANVPKEKVSWIHDSVLFCYLAANAKHDQQKEPVKWFRSFIRTLESIGWLKQSSEFSNYSFRVESSATFEEISANVLSKVATKEQLAIINTFMESLKSDAQKLSYFEGKSYSNREVHFQILICDVEPTTGELVISIVGIQATLEKHAKYYFFCKHDDVKLLAEHQNVTLNEDTFKATVLPMLKDRLSGFQDQLIIWYVEDPNSKD